MAKPRRGVQFQHRGSNASQDRPSLADLHGGASQPGSPLKPTMNGDGTEKEETDHDEVWRCIQATLRGV
jgi:hypothetical protein